MALDGAFHLQFHLSYRARVQHGCFNTIAVGYELYQNL